MVNSGILTEAEAAALIVGLKPQTLAKWRLRRKGPRYLKLGGKVRYRKADVELWIEQSVVDPAQHLAHLKKHIKRKAA